MKKLNRAKERVKEESKFNLLKDIAKFFIKPVPVKVEEVIVEEVEVIEEYQEVEVIEESPFNKELDNLFQQQDIQTKQLREETLATLTPKLQNIINLRESSFNEYLKHIPSLTCQEDHVVVKSEHDIVTSLRFFNGDDGFDYSVPANHLLMTIEFDCNDRTIATAYVHAAGSTTLTSSVSGGYVHIGPHTKKPTVIVLSVWYPRSQGNYIS